MIIIIFGRATQFLLGLATMKVATILLSPLEMGRVSLILATTAFFALFLVNPVGMFVNRRLHGWQDTGTARQHLARYLGYLLLVAAVGALAVLALTELNLMQFGLARGWLILLVCGSLFFNTINQTAIPSLNLLGHSRSFVALTIASTALSFVIAVALVRATEPLAQYWLLGLLLGQTLLGLWGSKVLFAHLRAAPHSAQRAPLQRSHLRTLYRFAWPVAIAAGLGWVQAQAYRYLMGGWLGLEQLGLFVAGYGISVGIVAGFESVLTTYFQPRLYRDANGKSAQEQARAWRVYAGAVLPSLVLTIALIVALAPELTRLFLGERFHSAADFVIWGALAEAARVLAGVYALIAHIRMRTRHLVIPNIVGAALSLGLCALLIPRWGAVGAGVGLAISGFSVVGLLYLSLVSTLGEGGTLPPLTPMWAGVAVLLATAPGMRWLLAGQGWLALSVNIAVMGLLFTAFQYFYLRRHLFEDSRIGLKT